MAPLRRLEHLGAPTDLNLDGASRVVVRPGRMVTSVHQVTSSRAPGGAALSERREQEAGLEQ
jgi:hypothetical protein